MSTSSKDLIAERWQRIRQFELDDPLAELPFSKALAREMEWDEEFAQLAIDEYKRFILLSSLFPDMIPAIHVDTVWHMHLLYTRSYQQFCRQALDRDFLHHEPAKGDKEEDELFANQYLETLHKYGELFGPPPSAIWGELALSITAKSEPHRILELI